MSLLVTFWIRVANSSTAKVQFGRIELILGNHLQELKTLCYKENCYSYKTDRSEAYSLQFFPFLFIQCTKLSKKAESAL